MCPGLFGGEDVDFPYDVRVAVLLLEVEEGIMVARRFQRPAGNLVERRCSRGLIISQVIFKIQEYSRGRGRPAVQRLPSAGSGP